MNERESYLFSLKSKADDWELFYSGKNNPFVFIIYAMIILAVNLAVFAFDFSVKNDPIILFIGLLLPFLFWRLFCKIREAKSRKKYQIALLEYYLELFPSTNQEIIQAVGLALKKKKIDDNYLLLSSICNKFESYLEKKENSNQQSEYDRIKDLVDEEFNKKTTK